MCWQDKKRPGPKKKLRTRKTINATVHPSVADFLEQYKEDKGVGSTGKLIDRLISSKFPHVKIEEEA